MGGIIEACQDGETFVGCRKKKNMREDDCPHQPGAKAVNPVKSLHSRLSGPFSDPYIGEYETGQEAGK